jgi:hypothetical protein
MFKARANQRNSLTGPVIPSPDASHCSVKSDTLSRRAPVDQVVAMLAKTPTGDPDQNS